MKWGIGGLCDWHFESYSFKIVSDHSDTINVSSHPPSGSFFFNFTSSPSPKFISLRHAHHAVFVVIFFHCHQIAFIIILQLVCHVPIPHGASLRSSPSTCKSIVPCSHIHTHTHNGVRRIFSAPISMPKHSVYDFVYTVAFRLRSIIIVSFIYAVLLVSLHAHVP